MQSTLSALLPLWCSELKCLAHYQECVCGVRLQKCNYHSVFNSSSKPAVYSIMCMKSSRFLRRWLILMYFVFYGTWSFHVHNDVPLNPYAPQSENKKFITEVQSSDRESEYQTQSLADPGNTSLVLPTIHIRRYSSFLYRFDNALWTMWVLYSISLHGDYIWLYRMNE